MKIDEKALICAAISARERAYAPYSRFKVGAALLTEKGQVYTGCNIENAGYTPTVCAERTAIFKAVSEGARRFAAIAIVGSMEGEMNKLPTAPCGVCRQVMAEFCQMDMPVIMAQTSGEFITMRLGELLPLSFGPANLHTKEASESGGSICRKL